jgi:hypothetical protein
MRALGPWNLEVGHAVKQWTSKSLISTPGRGFTGIMGAPCIPGSGLHTKLCVHPLSGEEGQLIRSLLPNPIPSFPALFREDTTYSMDLGLPLQHNLETSRIQKSK